MNGGVYPVSVHITFFQKHGSHYVHCFITFLVCVICNDVLAQLTLELHFGINSHNNFFKEGYFLMFRIMVGQEICLWMKS